MECTHCGNKELVKTLIEIKCPDGEGHPNISDVDVFLCTKCGHLDLFSPEKVSAYRNITTLITDTEKQIVELETKLVSLSNDLNSINNQISEVEKK